MGSTRAYIEANRDKSNAQARAWRAANPEKVKASLKKWRAKNKERVAAWSKAKREVDPEAYRANRKRWRAAHADKANAATRAWRAAYPDKHKAAEQRWRAANPAVITAYVSKRMALKLRATPAWANMTAILGFYIIAVEMERTTGLKHAVDHIVPLQSKLVCGLHCEANMQVLTKRDNSRKGNRTWPDKP
jgi:hypothetical protein